ncbi:hypothetical protein [Sorangium sp. So ce1335]|uniref:hypothetical protein n=1 Tax=Sorangium sp. So ce1335 TaxID=3133335 RepID=UPI003F60D65C
MIARATPASNVPPAAGTTIGALGPLAGALAGTSTPASVLMDSRLRGGGGGG